MSKNFVSNKDETVRMFESDFMEVFSRVHFSVPLFIYMPVIFYFLYRSIFLYELSAVSIFALVILGVAVWTLTEYNLHRFIFHFEFKSELGHKIHFIFHGVHHDCQSSTEHCHRIGGSRLGDNVRLAHLVGERLRSKPPSRHRRAALVLLSCCPQTARGRTTESLAPEH